MNPGRQRTGLSRNISSTFPLAVTISGVIGLGILRNPGEIASVIPEATLYIGLWLVAGLFVLLSTSVVAELVGMTPQSGGTYTLVRNAYGPYPGFVIGWVDWLSFVGDIALKAVVAMEFIALLFPAATPWNTPLAIMLTTVFAALQLRGIALGSRIQQIASVCMALIVLGFSFTLLFAGPAVISDPESAPVIKTGISAWSLVIATIIFTYDGWLYAAYFNGEIKGGAGAVARASVKGICTVIILYLLLNLAMVWAVPLTSLAGEEFALARALELVISPTAASAVILAGILILLSQQNLLYMGAPRILHALSHDGLASQRARTVSSGGNPMMAVLFSWAVSVVLIMIGGFYFLLHLCVLFFVLIYLILISGVLILRKRKPESERPFKAWGHPYSTIFCLIVWALITLFQAVSEPETALYAAVMVAVSWPVYRFLISRKKINS